MAGAALRSGARLADLLSLPADRHAEIVDGEIVEKASPSAEHSDAQGAITTALRTSFHHGGGRGPGGWWILPEVDVELEPQQIYRPDVSGWRRDRVPARPSGRPITILPDWICEVLSPSNAENDLSKKFRVFQRRRVPHYWVIDPEHEVLTAYRWTPQGYLVAVQAGRTEVVHAEPFEAMELRVGALFGDDTV